VKSGVDVLSTWIQFMQLPFSQPFVSAYDQAWGRPRGIFSHVIKLESAMDKKNQAVSSKERPP